MRSLCPRRSSGFCRAPSYAEHPHNLLHVVPSVLLPQHCGIQDALARAAASCQVQRLLSCMVGGSMSSMPSSSVQIACCRLGLLPSAQAPAAGWDSQASGQLACWVPVPWSRLSAHLLGAPCLWSLKPLGRPVKAQPQLQTPYAYLTYPVRRRLLQPPARS